MKDFPHAGMVVMDVHDMRFDRQFDVVLCLQNGLSAMRADDRVIKDIIGLLAPGGAAYFSSYSAKFWDCRLKWFEAQASKGLLGAIDPERTKDGVTFARTDSKRRRTRPMILRGSGRLQAIPIR